MDSNCYNIQISAQQGWQCPVCGQVNAPWISQCPCNGKIPSYTTTVSTGETIRVKLNYNQPPYNAVTTRTPLKTYGYTTSSAHTTTMSNEKNCDNCLGGCDLCYYCENGDHYISLKNKK